jgi:hypothetical protein
MRCIEFHRRLQAQLDARGRLVEDSQLCQHALECADCGDYLSAWQQIGDALGARTELPQGFADSVIAAVRPARTDRTARSAMAFTGLAVTLLLWGSLVAFRSMTSARQPVRHPQPASSAVAENLGIPAEPPVPSGSTASTTIKPEDAQSYRNLWRELLERIAQADVQVESVDRITGSFRPLAATLNAAFGALRRSWPGGGDSA